jgi:hypothetical protein
MQATKQLPLSQDAAVVIALAGTAMPFAHSAEDEAERWLRVLRLHGHVGSALQALGVGEAPLMTGSEPNGEEKGSPRLGPAIVDQVAASAREVAAARGADAVGTADLLFAVMDAYGRRFDRALYLRGSSREELVERITGIEHRSG